MATVVMKVLPGEVLKVWPWSRVEPAVRHGGVPAGTQLTQVTADAAGLATISVTSRLEYAVQRANGVFVKVLDSTTRHAPL